VFFLPLFVLYKFQKNKVILFILKTFKIIFCLTLDEKLKSWFVNLTPRNKTKFQVSFGSFSKNVQIYLRAYCSFLCPFLSYFLCHISLPFIIFSNVLILFHWDLSPRPFGFESSPLPLDLSALSFSWIEFLSVEPLFLLLV
jgi:hypothetical protein